MKGSCYEKKHDRKALLRDLVEQGWNVRATHDGCFFIQTPDRRFGTSLHLTASDVRAGKNFDAAIRRMKKQLENGYEIL